MDDGFYWNKWNEDKAILSQLFFHHRVYLNGKQIFLEPENFENFKQILDEYKPKNLEDIAKLYNPEIIRRIFGKLIPEDAIIINENNENGYLLRYNLYFFSKSSYKEVKKEPSLFKPDGLKQLKNLSYLNIPKIKN